MQGRYFLVDTSMLPGSWTLVTLQVLLDGSQALLSHTTGNETVNVARGGMSSNASCIMSYRCGPKSSQTFEVLDGTAVMRGLLAQNEVSESLSFDLVSILALGDVDPLGRSSPS